MDTLDYALMWHERGVSPIPLLYRSKKPIVEWGIFRSTLPPTALIKRWFSGLRNIAIIINQDYVILDFDLPIEYHRWRMRYRLNTYTVKSNRGYHVYLQVDEPVNTAPMSGGEILASGHMVTVPCSVHQSGRRYVVINDSPILRVESVAAIGITPIEIERDEHHNVVGNYDDYTPRAWLPTGERQQSDELPIERIKRYISIASLLGQTAKQASFVMRCPFHDDSTPSLQVWPTDNRAYCHAPHCKAHRSIDVIDCAELLWKVDKRRAISMLASQC
jgi:hypothetical protein